MYVSCTVLRSKIARKSGQLQCAHHAVFQMKDLLEQLQASVPPVSVTNRLNRRDSGTFSGLDAMDIDASVKSPAVESIDELTERIVPRPDVLCRAKLDLCIEQSKIMWLQGDKKIAVRMLKDLLQSPSVNLDSKDFGQHYKAKILLKLVMKEVGVSVTK